MWPVNFEDEYYAVRKGGYQTRHRDGKDLCPDNAARDAPLNR